MYTIKLKTLLDIHFKKLCNLIPKCDFYKIETRPNTNNQNKINAKVNSMLYHWCLCMYKIERNIVLGKQFKNVFILIPQM